MRSINDLLTRLDQPRISRLPAPTYQPKTVNPSFPPNPPFQGGGEIRIDRGPNVGLAVESMRRHTSDEGWVLFEGLDHAGYELAGYGLDTFDQRGHSLSNLTDVHRVLSFLEPSVVVVQDKREWEGQTAGPGFDPRERFTHITDLKDRSDIFKVTILKDAHQKPEYHKQSAEEMGCHAWVVYYHPRIVAHLAPYVRPQHLIRTYHSVDVLNVPAYASTANSQRVGCLLSGAVSNVYPLRKRLIENLKLLPGTVFLPHPGYHRNGCATPQFLETLSHFKVAICTSSVYGYALRKIIEASACGCRVITDLPVDEVLPEIDHNLIRVSADSTPQEIGKLLIYLYKTYNVEFQEDVANRARVWYDWRVVGERLVNDIERMRRKYL